MYFVFSDLHGSVKAMDAIIEAIAEEKPDRILLLGDILHGAYDGDARCCEEKLRPYAAAILAVSGNCDYSSDEFRLGFALPETRTLNVYGRATHLSHRPATGVFPEGCLVLNGHTHRKAVYEDNGVIFLNPGSCALPRDEEASYATIDEQGIYLRRLSDRSLITTKLF